MQRKTPELKSEAEIQASIASHEARNAELLHTLRAKGVALDELHDTEHHFWAYSRESADSLADALRKRQYIGPTVTKADTEDGSSLWSIEAAFNRTLTEAASHTMSDELVRLAAEYDADYDGWGVSV